MTKNKSNFRVCKSQNYHSGQNAQLMDHLLGELVIIVLSDFWLSLYMLTQYELEGLQID